LRSPMGRAFAELCRWKGCLPSELYDKCDPTIGDMMFVSAYCKIKDEEENEKLKGIVG